MRKLIGIILMAVMLISLTACGSSSADKTNTTGNAASKETAGKETAGLSDTPADVQTTAPEEPGGEKSRILIAYFSWSGNTEQLAGMIEEKTGGDLFKIEPQTPYTDDYNELLDVAKQEQSDGARPETSAKVENWEDYDVIFVGYPNWWNDAPMLILSFLESYDCAGKTVVPFCTSGGGGFGRSESSVKASADGAAFADGFHVNGNNVGNAKDSVNAWLDGLDILK